MGSIRVRNARVRKLTFLKIFGQRMEGAAVLKRGAEGKGGKRQVEEILCSTNQIWQQHHHPNNVFLTAKKPIGRDFINVQSLFCFYVACVCVYC